jgi:hypothetical protein
MPSLKTLFELYERAVAVDLRGPGCRAAARQTAE